MSFIHAYESLIDYDRSNVNKQKSEKKKFTKKDTSKKDSETRKRSRSKSPIQKAAATMEESNPDIPSRQYGDLYCEVCDSHMNSEQTWEAHIIGKRHIKNSRKGDQAEQKYEYSSDEPTIQKELDKETRPIAGLDHICEIIRINQPSYYQCFLCSASLLTPKLLIEHVVGLKHQMAFLKENDKEKFSLVDTSSLSKSYLEPIINDLIMKYEAEHGRGKMSVKKEKGKPGSSFSYKKSNGNVRHTSPKPKYSPPPKSGRYSPPPKSGRYSPPLKSGRYSPPPKSGRYSPPPKSSRYSPPKSFRYSPPPKSYRYSPPPKSSRAKERSLDSEWKKVSPVRERSRERYSDRTLYPEEDNWQNIEPESAFYRRLPSDYDIDSRLEQANNSRHALPLPDAGKNYSDLRVVLEQKKNLGMTSAAARANVGASTSAPSEINSISDGLLRLVDDMSPKVFLSLALLKLDSMHVQEEMEFRLLEVVANKANALANNAKMKPKCPDLKAKFKETLAQNGIPPESNTMLDTSCQSNQQFTQNLDNLIGHYKSRKTTAYEDAGYKVSYPPLKASEQYMDNRSSSLYQSSSSEYRNAPEKPSSFNSEWNQRSSTTSLPFQSFSSTPTNIPGLTLTEEPPAQTSTAMNQFAQTAQSIFGNINVPSAPTNTYPNDDYNRLNYRY